MKIMPSRFMNHPSFYQTGLPLDNISASSLYRVPMNYQLLNNPIGSNFQDFRTIFQPQASNGPTIQYYPPIASPPSLTENSERDIFDLDSPSISSQSDNSILSIDSFPTQYQQKSNDYSIRPVPTTASSDENDGTNDENEGSKILRKRKKHTQVEKQRRQLEKSHFREMSILLSDSTDSQTAKHRYLDLLNIATKKIIELHTKHTNDPLKPSNLTEKELNYLLIQANTSFVFVLLLEINNQFGDIVYVTDSIQRVLNFTSKQIINKKFYDLIHPDDVEMVRNELNSLSYNLTSGIKCHLKCKIRKSLDNNTYTPIIIDGITKYIRKGLLLSSVADPSSTMFVVVCVAHLPRIVTFADKNQLQNNDTLRFRCRCSPKDWKIFLIDRSYSNLDIGNGINDTIGQCLFNFIHNNQQILQLFEQASIRQIVNEQQHKCQLKCNGNLILMNLTIKSHYNPVTHQPDFIECTFDSCSSDTNHIQMISGNLDNNFTFNPNDLWDDTLIDVSQQPEDQTLYEAFFDSLDSILENPC
ncbi:unnamed protein product [Didymodactylos carnosus]|uniref:Uncharacterized protein n=1 Tax=Didymodactylos carnosus TaxID=1234261 RepID=A0A8S2I8F9_9BILA|nr:unnamed protein product [Didymodactylos carnosus]CAF3729750.1 unnamed protein product [Didymodactylos carnosus]